MDQRNRALFHGTGRERKILKQPKQARLRTLKNATADDFTVISRQHALHQKTAAPLQVLDTLRRLDDVFVGFRVSQLTHCLMTATLARRAKANSGEVVAALCHDIGKILSIPNHGPIAAEMMKPYVEDYIYHSIYWHQHFQGRYYYNHIGKPTDLRAQFKDESWFAFACKLVDEWDAPAFDPDFEVDPLESFEDIVREVFSNPKDLA